MTVNENEKRFYQNLEYWRASHPKEAVMLPYAETDELVFCRTKKGELNLSKKFNGEWTFYHDPEGALIQMEQWFSSLDLTNQRVLYIYGVGLGYAYSAVKHWLKKKHDRYVVFLEDDLAVIHRLFETEEGSRLLENSRVKLIYLKSIKDPDNVFDTLYWNFAMTKMAVSALPFYGEVKRDVYAELSQKIAYDAAVKNALLDEYMRYGGAFFINFYQNILALPGSYFGNTFFNKYSKVPAIICGAGPSLKKNVDFLKTLTDKALVFAGGSAMNVLNAAGFSPHFGGGIDPNAAQHDRMSSNQAYEVPYFYRNRIFHDAFNAIRGPRLYITGCGGYDVAEYFEKNLGLEGELIDEGHNVVNFCVEVANAMGCDPIIFVGMDLAFTGMQMYAPGVVDDADVDETVLLKGNEEDTLAIRRTDIDGQPIFTLWKWIAEADWIGDFAKSHPQVKLINATEGGLGFPGVSSVTLKEAAEKHLLRQYNLFDRVHTDIQESAMPHVTQEKVDEAALDLKASLVRCIDHFQTLIDENKKLKAKIKEDHTLAPQLQSGMAALAETDLAEEEGFRHVCEIFNAVYMRLLGRQLHELRAPGKSSAVQWRKNIKIINLNIKRLKFVQNVAKVNISLINFAFQLRKEEKDGK
jgi:hypothetical protein